MSESLLRRVLTPFFVLNTHATVFADRIGAYPIFSSERYSAIRPNDVLVAHVVYFVFEILLIGFVIWVGLENGIPAMLFTLFSFVVIGFWFVSLLIRGILEFLLLLAK